MTQLSVRFVSCCRRFFCDLEVIGISNDGVQSQLSTFLVIRIKLVHKAVTTDAIVWLVSYGFPI